jgi:hypothetical protein
VGDLLGRDRPGNLERKQRESNEPPRA